MFRIAYAFTKKEQLPKQTTLCSFFWRLVAMAIGLALLNFMAWTVFFGIAIPLAFLVAGHKLALDGEDFFVPIKRWPKFRGHHIWPGAVLLIGAASTIVSFGIWRIGHLIPLLIAWLETNIELPFVFWGTLVVMIPILTVIGFRKFTESSAGQLTRDYLRAKKEKVCPIIFIKHEEEGKES